MPTSFSLDLHRIAFSDSLNGWVVGDAGLVLHSPDRGSTFIRHSFPDSILLLDVATQSRDTLAILGHRYPDGTGTPYGTSLYLSSDGGNSWAERFFPEHYYFAITFQQNGPIWMGGEFGYLASSGDWGQTWEEPFIDSTGFAFFPLRRIKFFDSLNGMAFGGALDITGVVWQTRDGGLSWTVADPGPEPVLGMHRFDALNYLGVGGDFDQGSGMIRSSDGGITWEDTYLGIFGEASALSFRTATEGWAPLGFDQTLMKTTDSGESWEVLPVPGGYPINDLLFLDEQTGFMVGGRGGLFRYDPQVGIDADRPAAEALSPLWQVTFQPNPTAGAVRLALKSREAVRFTLRIFDLLGRPVIELPQFVRNSGDHAIALDLSHLSNGIYFYRLEGLSLANKNAFHLSGKLQIQR
ncbi:MAG TPA: T9SS type A sorting domain-containing protein [Calditrichia bacterium]|nr:T9SS type A sorting domain-containing protein [Calditrichia bacterium]